MAEKINFPKGKMDRRFVLRKPKLPKIFKINHTNMLTLSKEKHMEMEERFKRLGIGNSTSSTNKEKNKFSFDKKFSLNDTRRQ